MGAPGVGSGIGGGQLSRSQPNSSCAVVVAMCYGGGVGCGGL